LLPLLLLEGFNHWKQIHSPSSTSIPKNHSLQLSKQGSFTSSSITEQTFSASGMESFNVWTLVISFITLFTLYYLFRRRKILPCAGGVVITGASSGIGE